MFLSATHFYTNTIMLVEIFTNWYPEYEKVSLLNSNLQLYYSKVNKGSCYEHLVLIELISNKKVPKEYNNFKTAKLVITIVNNTVGPICAIS